MALVTLFVAFVTTVRTGPLGTVTVIGGRVGVVPVAPESLEPAELFVAGGLFWVLEPLAPLDAPVPLDVPVPLPVLLEPVGLGALFPAGTLRRRSELLGCGLEEIERGATTTARTGDRR